MEMTPFKILSDEPGMASVWLWPVAGEKSRRIGFVLQGFNDWVGSCPTCRGLGFKADLDSPTRLRVDAARRLWDHWTETHT